VGPLGALPLCPLFCPVAKREPPSSPSRHPPPHSPPKRATVSRARAAAAPRPHRARVPASLRPPQLYGSWDDDNQGWQDNRQYFSDLAKCNNTNDEHGEDKEVAGRTVVDGIVICTAAFLLWVSPFVLFGVLVFLGSFLILMSRMLASGNKKSSEQLLRVFGIAIFSAFFGMYSASSVGGAEMGLSNVALAIYASIVRHGRPLPPSLPNGRG